MITVNGGFAKIVNVETTDTDDGRIHVLAFARIYVANDTARAELDKELIKVGFTNKVEVKDDYYASVAEKTDVYTKEIAINPWEL